ncbi:interleukin-1 receptor type 2-like [Heptranchias perlo]|uniref:interleukin-1 receptor type 2-like n=1 Tax=Heptranchias perlo TaxID=212740 RepID=UPI00355AA188
MSHNRHWQLQPPQLRPAPIGLPMMTKSFQSPRAGHEILWTVAMPLAMLLNGLVTAEFSGDGGRSQGPKGNEPPTITIPVGTTINAECRKPLELICKAVTGYSDRFSTIIYWLANQQFIEDAFVDGRVKEGLETFLTENGKIIIQKSLNFSTTTLEDFKTNFTCAVMNPSGNSVKTITLVEKKASLSKTDRYIRKLRKCKRSLDACLHTAFDNISRKGEIH